MACITVLHGGLAPSFSKKEKKKTVSFHCEIVNLSYLLAYKVNHLIVNGGKGEQLNVTTEM